MTPLQHITHLLDTTLRIREIKDAPVALNGLQVENNGQVTKVALAVDGSQKTIEDAIAVGADLLILHHGIYWCGLRPMTGWFKKKIETCLQHNLAIYGAHLPLDLHPELGNNAGIAQALGLSDCTPEVDYHGTLIGVAGTFNGTVAELRDKYASITGSCITGFVQDAAAPAGRVAVCSGGAGDVIYQMHEKGYRTYLTGEENHWVVNAAQDMGVNILFAGHYATETFGVKALGKLLETQFGLPTVFIDNPTGM
ncbi:MAG: Nif3-like dinuclear metal center hexameric protein [Akkermansiaceae bacterium]|nr:Nif3-like dinuclear metal center hexameric protein [Akkermansiaceae bacterium]